MVSWFQGVIRTRYDLPIILEGVLALEVVQRAFARPQWSRSLEMTINAVSCPGTGQICHIFCTFKQAFTEE
jgi:hypothetical protein